MSARSHGRPTPSRGARVERRKAERAQRPASSERRTTMRIPDAIRALTDEQLPAPEEGLI